MHNFAKRVTSAVIAAAVVFGTLTFYPTGNKGRVNAAQLYDSASAINYSTILGGAVDYGVVANKIVATSHTETTFATFNYENNEDTNIDVDFITSTGLFLVGEVSGTHPTLKFGKTTASSLYLEAAPQVLEGYDPNAEKNKDGWTTGHIGYTNQYYNKETQTFPDFTAVENVNATSNVERIINRICSNKPVEDAELGWSYFLNNRATNPDYKFDISGCTEDHNSYIVINLLNKGLENKVAYINIGKDNASLLKYLCSSSGFRIEKDPSTVVVINIEDDALENSGLDDTSKLTLTKPIITVNGTDYAGSTVGTNGDDDQAPYIQEFYNDKIIWNIMESSDIDLDEIGGVVLSPKDNEVTLSGGNSSGWLVTKGTFNMAKEFHFLYSGSSHDKYGDMHFALNKAFTDKYAEHGSVIQDTSVSIPDNNTYKFRFEEYSEKDSNGELTGATGNIKYANATEQGAVTFPILNFNNPSSEYYLPIPSEGTNETTLYFKVTEDPNGAPSGIVNSDGYINIILTAKVDTAGNYTYFVNYRSVTGKDPATGKNIVFKDYETSDIKMSGVQFDLGVFYNRSIVPGYLTLTKKIDGLTDTEITVLKNNIEFDVLDKDGKTVLSQKLKLASDFTFDTTKGTYVLNSDKLIQVPDAEATYTVVESGYTSTGYQETVSYTVSKASQVQVQTIKPNEANIASLSTKQDEPSVVAYNNSYRKNTVVTYGYFDITKTFGGDATASDFKNLSFEVYEVDASTTPATETLKYTIPFDASNFIESNGTYSLRSKRNLDTSKTYMVKEINYDVTGETVIVEYKLPGGNNTQAVDGKSETFSVAEDNYADNPYVVAFTNSFTKSTNNVDISVSKRVLGTGSTYNEFQGAKLTLTRTDDTSYVFTDDNFVAGNGVTGKVIRGNTISFVSGSTESAFRNLPDGTYTLEETDYPIVSGVTYTKATTLEFEVENGIATQKSATAADNGIEGDTVGNQTLYLIDSPMGYIKIVKTLTGVNNLDDVAPITFTVVNKADSTDTIDIPDLKSANCVTGKWVPNGNTYTYVIPTPIAVGNTYTVTESAPSSKTVGNTVYTLTSSTDPIDVTVVGGTVETATVATFKNAYTTSNATGSLSVKKVINSSGDQIPADVKAFIITVTFNTDITNATAPDGTTKAGKVWTITADPDKTYTISGVPDGATYTVEETGIFTTSTQALTSEYNVTYTNETGTIDANATNPITSIVTNKYTAPQPDDAYITLTKTVGGGVTASDIEGLTFTVYKSSDDSVVGTALTLKNDFELKSGTTDTYVLKNPIKVEAGESYYVVESNTAITGYDLVKVTYKLDGDTTATEITTASTFSTGTITPTAANTDTNAFGVEFTNEYKSNSTPNGSLVINKTIVLPAGVTLDKIGTITFEVTDSDGKNVATVELNPGNPGTGWTANGNDFTYTVSPVTEGKEYFVKETCDTTSTSYTASSNVANNVSSIVIPVGTPGSVAFTNTYSTVTVYTGSLVITKTIDLPSGATMADIGDITFTISPAAGGVSTVVLDPDNPGTGWTVNGNVFTYTISGLTQGESYDINESVDGSTSSYSVKVTRDTQGQVTIPIDSTNTSVSAGFTNTYTSTLPTSGYIEFTKTFGGDVTEAEAAGCGLYFVITNDAGDYLDLDGNISSDEVRITLKDMDHTDGTLVWSKTITGVPFDTYYVTEHNEVIYINGGKVPYTFEKTTSVTTDHTTLWNTSEDGYFDLENYYSHPGFDVTISKEDIAGKEIAQAQLKFKSLDGYDLSKVVVTQNGVPVQFTLSENNTAITFTTIEGYPSIIQGLFSGRYELEETVTPEAYLTAEKIVFVLNNDGTITDGEGKISAYGSPVVMIDHADPYYDTEVISANRTPNPIPATGEKSNFIALVGIALVGLCSAALAGLGVYRKKRNEF